MDCASMTMNRNFFRHPRGIKAFKGGQKFG